MKENDIQAFPVVGNSKEQNYLQEGMTLRDYFAAKALTVIPFMAEKVFQNENSWSEKEIADEAYRIADEMLKTRLV